MTGVRLPRPVQTTEVSLAQWATQDRVAAAVQREQERGTMDLAWDHRALAATGIAVEDQQAYAGDGDVDVEALDIVALLLALLRQWPTMPVRDAMGWLIVLQHLWLESIVHESQALVLVEVTPTVTEWAAADSRLLRRGWAFLAAGFTPAEAADAISHADAEDIDLAGLVAVAALRGCPTPTS